MATVNIQIVSGANNYGISQTLSSSDLTRLINAYTGIYGTTNNTDTGLAWANQLVQTTKQTVRNYEQQQAVIAAKAGVSDITIS